MPFLSILTEDELAIMQNYLIPKQFSAQECILKEGDPGDGCFIIDEGTVRLEVKNVETDSDGVIGFLDSGNFLGEFSLLDGKPRSATAYAHTTVNTRWFSNKSYEEICQLYPNIGLRIATALGQNLTTKLRQFNEKIAGYIFAGDIDKDTQELVDLALKAQQSFENWEEDRVDALLKDISQTIADKAEELAKATVTETDMGIVEDKITKIRFASLEVYKTIVGKSATGLINTDTERQVTEIASPVGVILGLIPVTNPIPTIIFKTLIALKGRNALILSCHRSALNVGNQACDIIRDVLAKHNAPINLIQSVRQRTSRQKTMMFMNHPQVSLILATGGTSMVKAAYSSGTPAIGVGSGNAPVLICSNADIEHAAKSVIQSKSFDNGVICGSENNLVVVSSVRDKFIKMLEENGAFLPNEEEKQILFSTVFDSENHTVRRSIVGKSAQYILDLAGIQCNRIIRLIVIPITQVELAGPMAHEKLTPVLSLFTANDEIEGIEICKQILNNQGRGHTAVIYTTDQELMRQFGREIEASRILVNSPSSQGCVGLGTGLLPSFTLGCGTFGGNSTTDNIGFKHLLNIKRLALYL